MSVIARFYLFVFINLIRDVRCLIYRTMHNFSVVLPENSYHTLLHGVTVRNDGVGHTPLVVYYGNHPFFN